MILATIKLFEDVDEDHPRRTVGVAVRADELFALEDGEHFLKGWVCKHALAYVDLVNAEPRGDEIDLVVRVEDQEAQITGFFGDYTYRSAFIDLRPENIW
ncbi:MAG: hypothetical protein QXS54_06680 [Candidatus Methanomethylicaceae archaeon]